MDYPHENIKRHFKGVWSVEYKVTNEVFNKEEYLMTNVQGKLIQAKILN